ncbi:endonuclease/exonuclease/phosphatase family protein [Sphingobacterium griseoflavum]|uniref:Endonuclease/exonuclease/phosphatase domain-containing protein n=1 Tax=Sphingobacterium griseoflavum TaxID=1474952 RepID=A0ABQ3I1I6_9SPHI|nr:endonuclease/exonuclease/phosphatase family protein [Sphingobacterium griseoflavum]GHE45502.1 hypothetical protein GCM10017764_30900 [Sphingobacterium griseoflavum]
MLKRLLPLILLFFYVALFAQKPQPFLPAAGIKVMTYNIHHGNPPSKDSLIDLEAIARVIRAQSPDIVALQEVDQFTRRSGNVDQAKAIAEQLGMHYFYAKAMDYDAGAYGQAILSRFPIRSTAVRQLPSAPEFRGEPRILGEAFIQLPNGSTLRFGTVHLDAQKSEANRLLQAKALQRILAEQKTPMIIAGDFNAIRSSEAMKVLDAAFTHSCTTCAFTIPVLKPNKTIDYILLDKRKTWSVVSHETIQETYASDHFPVVTVLQ